MENPKLRSLNSSLCMKVCSYVSRDCDVLFDGGIDLAVALTLSLGPTKLLPTLPF